jgi:hypothetical protein
MDGHQGVGISTRALPFGRTIQLDLMSRQGVLSAQ